MWNQHSLTTISPNTDKDSSKAIVVRSWTMVARLRKAKLRQLGLEKGNYSDNKAIVVRKWGRWRDFALLTLASLGTQSGHIAAPANYLTLPKPHFDHDPAILGYRHGLATLVATITVPVPWSGHIHRFLLGMLVISNGTGCHDCAALMPR